MRVLVTGGAGFLGSNLVDYLLTQGDEVLVVDNNWGDRLYGSHRFSKYSNPNLQIRNVDIFKDAPLLESSFENFKPDVCYALAAYAAEGRSNHIRSFIHSNNTVGMANVINKCVQFQVKLVFTSSVAVYSGDPPFTEDTTPNPIDEYGLSKLMSEKSIEIAGDVQDLDWCIIRPRNVFGPWQSMTDPARNFFGIMCYRALNNLPIQIYGDGLQTRCFTYVDDLIYPMYRAKDVSKEIINLGSALRHSVLEAAQIFSEVSGYKNIVHTEPRHEVKDAWCTTEKSERLLGFVDKTTLREGIEKMWAWAKDQPMRRLDKMPPLEVTVNAHSSLK